jgi:hypothetical protein
MMKKTLFVTLMASLMVLFSGCGSNDFDGDGNTTTSIKLTVVTPAGGTYAITTADHDYSVVLKVTDDDEPLSGKVVKIATTSFVGSFSAAQATTDGEGKATFTYHSPGSVDTGSTFTVTYALEDDANVSATITFNIGSGGTTPIDSEVVDKINYAVAFEPADDAYNLGLGMQKSALVKLIDKDGNATIDNSKIQSITVTSQDPTILKLTQENGGAASASITVNNTNNITIQLVADEHNSGLAPLVIRITYTDMNGQSQTLEETFSITVMAGPPTAFSINSAGISYNFDTKQFEHKFLIQAVDNSGNPIASEGIINVSAMAGFAKDDNNRTMLYGRYAKDNDGISATLSSVGDKGQIQLAGITPFDAAHVNVNRAFVAVFGPVDTYEANGKWNIDAILANDALTFGNQYLGGDYTGLGMAVGYNYRDKICSSGYEESVVIVDSTDGSYTLSTEGKAFVTLKFDSYIIGKRTAVLVNMIGYDPGTGEFKRSGEVKFTTEAFTEYLLGETIDVPKGSVNLPVSIYGVIDTDTDDEFYLRNSTFSCEVELDGAHIVAPGAAIRNDPNSCEFGGRAYFGYHLTADSNDTDGSITFKKCQVNAEAPNPF